MIYDDEIDSLTNALAAEEEAAHQHGCEDMDCPGCIVNAALLEVSRRSAS